MVKTILRLITFFSHIMVQLILIVVLLASYSAPAQTAEQLIPPKPAGYVNDYAGILTPQQKSQLNTILRTYEDTTSNQVVVAIFPDAGGLPVEDFSIRLAEAWRVGQAGRDNGVILVVFLKERKVRIEVGYGLEDVIPDARALEIVRKYIIPHFREGNYYEGIREGVLAIMSSAAGKYAAFEKKRRVGSPGINPAAVVFFFIIVLVLLLGRGRRKSYTFGSRGYRSSGPIFWGGFGGGSGGGFGGGGFSGGGGGFGGGGATGSW